MRNLSASQRWNIEALRSGNIPKGGNPPVLEGPISGLPIGLKSSIKERNGRVMDPHHPIERSWLSSPPPHDWVTIIIEKAGLPIPTNAIHSLPPSLPVRGYGS